MSLANEYLNISEMGRERSEMVNVFEGLRETLEEHLWKVWAYHTHRPDDVNGWVKSLNKHLARLRTYNVPKKGSKPNLTKEYLNEKLALEPFQKMEDITVLITNWKNEGYPVVKVPEGRIVDLRKMASGYVECIFSGKKFDPADYKLL